MNSSRITSVFHLLGSFSFLPLSVLLVSSALLSGCGVDVVSTSSSPTHLAIQGSVFGGSQPISGSHIYLYAANTTGYGGNGIAPSALNASISLLTANTSTTSDGNGNYYVTSGTDGSFSISGDYTPCASGSTTQVYLYATGGNPGAGNNSAIGLLAALGSCTAITSTTQIKLNEATTIAAAYSFAAFASDPTHVSSSGTPLAQVGIANAFLTAPTLVAPATGVPNTLTTTNSASGVTLNTTAIVATFSNILAACVNSMDTVTESTISHSANCNTLLTNAPSTKTPSTSPTDTATAAINMAHTLSPTKAQLTALYGLQPAIGAPYGGGLSSQFSDLALYVGYTLPTLGFNNGTMAIDGNGNVWLPAYSEATSFALAAMTTTGSSLPGSPFTGNGQSGSPASIAIDRQNNIWVSGTSSIAEFTDAGAPVSGSPFAAGDSGFLAFDGAGNLWSETSLFGTVGSLIEISATGIPIPGASYPIGHTLSSIAIDGSGSIWLNTNSNDISAVTKITNAGTAAPGSPYLFPNGYGNNASSALDSSGTYWTSVGTAGDPGTQYAYAFFSNTGTLSGPFPTFTNASFHPLATTGFSIDGAGVAWGAVESGGVFAATKSGQYASFPELVVGFIAAPYTATTAVDGSGNVWYSGENGEVVKIIGIAAPVITPIAAGLPSTFTTDGSSNLGTRP